MSIYIRPRVPGATVFFTVTLAHRGTTLLTEHIDLLRDAVRKTRAERPFGVDGWVVLPDHLHAVWTLPDDDADFSTRWGAIKARFTMAVRARCDDGGTVGRASARLPDELPVVRSGRYAGLKPGLRPSKRETGIWQRRFWEHHIRNAEDYRNHVRYCLVNPVKHGLVERPEEWPCSSIHRDIREGRFAA
ncbi:REP-associated tyrosine transposase [Histidinibacterium aquaticum]|uniref:Transposase n=1 Tax=Histidinibacterium aquaticum TaxID=2613962 RepID=A0A5J5GRQ8_9RHOB|nr:transposase [Histidinibacterium aquaticum]KAA9010062.1 transposase [Histidinibacterium aquaticum]